MWWDPNQGTTLASTASTEDVLLKVCDAEFLERRHDLSLVLGPDGIVMDKVVEVLLRLESHDESLLRG